MRQCFREGQEDVIFFVYFLSACVLMRTWRFAVMSCVCPLINYTLATEENVRNVRVCACCNHFPITWNKWHPTRNNFEYSHKVRFSKVFLREKIGDFTDLHNEKKINLEATFKRNRLGYWNSCKRLPNFVNVAALVLGKGWLFSIGNENEIRPLEKGRKSRLNTGSNLLYSNFFVKASLSMEPRDPTIKGPRSLC